ncbi:MAG: hypothetical protein IRZ07_13260 [Microbispora sp.]|nr:hypothetical protein [Microbispora sp.]
MGDCAAKRPGADIPLPPPYHGIHAGPPIDGYKKINWMKPTNRSDRVRVRLHTCECKATIYELCSAGGLMFIRRTKRGKKLEIHETERLIAARMEKLWARLLSGEAH